MTTKDYESRKWIPEKSAERKYWYRQRRKQRRSIIGTTPLRFLELISRDHLFHCFREVKKHGGPAAGPDEVSPADVSNFEFGDIAEGLSQDLAKCTYRPTPTRRKRVPKSSGIGTRPLRIGNLCDRVVGKAIHSALSPALDEAFEDGSWGFRPNRNSWGMLAAAANTIEAEDRWVIASDDIKDAFEHVRIDQAVDAHRHLLENKLTGHFHKDDHKQLLQLVETILRGSNPHRQVGIDQGHPYSPTALNVLLHHVHDAPLREGVVSFRWFRYADNLAYLCRSVPEGRQALAHVRRLLSNATPPDSAPMQLKGKPGVRDLSAREACPLLGFELRKRAGKLSIEIGKVSWAALGRQLEEAHESARPEVTARHAVMGWIESVGPASEKAESSVSNILHAAARCGFRELTSREEIRERWYHSWQRWQSLRRRAGVKRV